MSMWNKSMKYIISTLGSNTAQWFIEVKTKPFIFNFMILFSINWNIHDSLYFLAIQLLLILIYFHIYR